MSTWLDSNSIELFSFPWNIQTVTSLQKKALLKEQSTAKLVFKDIATIENYASVAAKLKIDKNSKTLTDEPLRVIAILNFGDKKTDFAFHLNCKTVYKNGFAYHLSRDFRDLTFSLLPYKHWRIVKEMGICEDLKN